MSITMFNPLSTQTVQKESVRPPGQFDVWSSIQSQIQKQEKTTIQKQEEAYTHPSLKRSSSILNLKSLEICTETLCSETGSDDFFESDFFSASPAIQSSNNARNTGSRFFSKTRKDTNISPPRKSFPPPLPSLSRKEGGSCMQIRTHRVDGRLVVQAVTVPAQNYLHAERQNGRLLLSFKNGTDSSSEENKEDETQPENVMEEIENLEVKEKEQEDEDEEEDEEEEVEVVDRGTIVEVKVSTQPQTISGMPSLKVHRSSIVINKFVSCNIPTNESIGKTCETNDEGVSQFCPVKRVSSTITTAAAAAVAASSVSAISAGGDGCSGSDNKLLFTSKRKNKEELLHDMRRCSELRKPLFIWEPCSIAT